MKKTFLFTWTIIVLQIISNAQNLTSGSMQNENIFSNFNNLPQKQLYDTAKFYFDNNIMDTALFFYSLLINSPVKETDTEQQKRVIQSYINSAVIYYNTCDYLTAYNYLIKALLLCEKVDYETYALLIYNNIGNIYHRFKKFDMAKLYFSKALNVTHDSTTIVFILNNIGSSELGMENLDSAFKILNKALKISKTHFTNNSYVILNNNVAFYYQKQNCYDSAYYYYCLSLDVAKKNNQIEYEAEILSSLGNLFFETNQLDSALFYFNLSTTIAKENSFLKILSENYLTLSKIEESKGNITRAFDYYKKHTHVKDSLISIDVFGDINQLQRLYEITKTNQQIEHLIIEKQIKERTIHYQRIIQSIILSVLMLMSVVLLFIYLQKRSLSRAYKALFEKNIEIIDIQKKLSKKEPANNKKKEPLNNMQDKLVDKILIVMEDTSLICDSDFTIDLLAARVQSNYTYVSQAINSKIKKNFRSFLNSYRIKEAQRIFSEPDVTNYTLEYVAQRVGFKSRTAFYEAFKEITGVSPKYYLKSVIERKMT